MMMMSSVTMTPETVLMYGIIQRRDQSIMITLTAACRGMSPKSVLDSVTSRTSWKAVLVSSSNNVLITFSTMNSLIMWWHHIFIFTPFLSQAPTQQIVKKISPTLSSVWLMAETTCHAALTRVSPRPALTCAGDSTPWPPTASRASSVALSGPPPPWPALLWE